MGSWRLNPTASALFPPLIAGLLPPANAILAVSIRQPVRSSPPLIAGLLHLANAIPTVSIRQLVRSPPYLFLACYPSLIRSSRSQFGSLCVFPPLIAGLFPLANAILAVSIRQHVRSSPRLMLARYPSLMRSRWSQSDSPCVLPPTYCWLVAPR